MYDIFVSQSNMEVWVFTLNNVIEIMLHVFCIFQILNNLNKSFIEIIN